MRQRVPMFGLVVALAIAACGGSAAPAVTFHPASVEPTAAPTAPPTAAPSPDATANPGGPTAAVTIFDNGFTEAKITIAAGTTVTWTNTGRRSHTVTSVDGTFGSDGSLSSGLTYAHTFATAGSFDYICTIHSDMRGTITVTP
ncbi:MAG: hypothetical protein EPO00_09825 [Chloroflexota bacterium]|nr:MAG: hypothetical protein EPO00_09825 [Chloroflexota bacterium]